MHCMLARTFIALLCVTLTATASAQITTGVVSGALKDEQGAVVPGATVTLISETRGTRVADAHTNGNGDFVFPNVPGDTYTVEVTLEGFKTLRRASLLVSPGDRVVVPTLTLSVGGLGETVDVKAEAAMIQAASGERAFTVTTESVENLPIANRNFAGFATLVPGAIAQSGTAIAGGVFRLGGGGQNNIMMDGVSTMDTGNNGQLISMNVDSIAEVKVLTAGLPSRVRAIERPADLGCHEERQQSVPGIALRHRAQLGLELEQLGEHQERRPETGLETARLGLLPWRAGGKARAAATGCSSSTATNTGRVRRAATSIASGCPTALERQGDFSQTPR